MNEKEFFSREFVLRCPVWLVVKLGRWKQDKSVADSLSLFRGEPSIGPFLPIFLNETVGKEIVKDLGLTDCGGIKVDTVDELCGVLRFLGKIIKQVPNAVVYLKKDRTRFYRLQDLQEELQSYRSN